MDEMNVCTSTNSGVISKDLIPARYVRFIRLVGR